MSSISVGAEPFDPNIDGARAWFLLRGFSRRRDEQVIGGVAGALAPALQGQAAGRPRPSAPRDADGLGVRDLPRALVPHASRGVTPSNVRAGPTPVRTFCLLY